MEDAKKLVDLRVENDDVVGLALQQESACRAVVLLGGLLLGSSIPSCIARTLALDTWNAGAPVGVVIKMVVVPVVFNSRSQQL